MTDSIRQRIMSAVDTRLKAILTSNGYETNAGQNVFDWREETLADTELPALIYRDTVCETTIETLELFSHALTVGIEINVQASTPMTTVRKILADIDRAINVDQQWGGLAILTERVRDESKVTEEAKAFGGCETTVVITYRTRGWDNYTVI